MADIDTVLKNVSTSQKIRNAVTQAEVYAHTHRPLNTSISSPVHKYWANSF